jgi:outer membrane lipopolysaccharide assembly protein LptE/RlpB
MRSTRAASLASALAAATALAGCGFDVQAPDDFLLTRTGQGPKLTLLVNDGGTIRCDGGKARTISNTLLISARDLVDNLDTDAKAKLRIAPSADSVYTYTIRTQDGTISFPDTAAIKRTELAGAEQFVLTALAGPCRGLS